METSKLVAHAQLEQKILFIRNERVILDTDLAILYGTTTKALNQAVKRNQRRFPIDFVFQLTEAEQKEVVTNCDHLKKSLFEAIKQLILPPPTKKRPIGFVFEKKNK